MANRSKNTAFLVFFIIALAAMAYATEASSKLQINSVEISIDGDTKIKTSGNNGEIEVSPGDELTIEVTLENLYDYDSGNIIEDTDVEARIYDIDDGADVSESENIDVRADREKTVTLTLDIPDEASPSESYDLEITAEGTDQDGSSQSDSLMIEVRVGHEQPELQIDEFDVSDADCGGAYLYLTIENAGEEEVDDARLRVSTERGQVYTETFDIAGLGDPEEDSAFTLRKRISFSLGEGDHTAEARIEYSAGQETETAQTRFYVDTCDDGYDGTARQDDESDDSDGGLTSEQRWEKEYMELRAERSKVELLMYEDTYVEPQTQKQTIVVPKAEESDGLGIAALLLGNIAVIIFIALIIYARYRD